MKLLTRGSLRNINSDGQTDREADDQKKRAFQKTHLDFLSSFSHAYYIHIHASSPPSSSHKHRRTLT